MSKFAQGPYVVRNAQKYVGKGVPRYRSSWEWAFMNFCDTNKSILRWGSEIVKIPYRNPLTGKHTVYVPDFFIEYVDKTGVRHMELIEIKPANQQLLEKVGKNKVNQALYIKNQAKWQAAQIWAKQNGIKFRVLNENDLFMNGKAR